MPDAIFVKINESEYNKFANSTTGPVGREIAKRAEKLRLYAVKQVGKDTGDLASTIHTSMHPSANGPWAMVGSNHRIALMHHNGTAPHVILPKRARMLRFSVRGRVVYARKVLHPGTRANRYLTDNLRRVVLD